MENEKTLSNWLYKQIGKAVKRADKNDLVTSNLLYVAQIANEMVKQYPKTPFTADDLFSEGCIGLQYAASKYDGERNDKFLGFAKPCIEGYIRNAILRKGSLVHIPMNHMTDKDIDTNIYSESIDADEYDKYGENEMVSDKRVREDILIAGISTLDETEQIVMKMKLNVGEYSKCKNKSIKDISDTIAKTKTETSQIYKAALEKLTKFCTAEYQV